MLTYLASWCGVSELLTDSQWPWLGLLLVSILPSAAHRATEPLHQPHHVGLTHHFLSTHTFYFSYAHRRPTRPWLSICPNKLSPGDPLQLSELLMCSNAPQKIRLQTLVKRLGTEDSKLNMKSIFLVNRIITTENVNVTVLLYKNKPPPLFISHHQKRTWVTLFTAYKCNIWIVYRW